MDLDFKKIELIEKTTGINLSNLGLSVRLLNCLKRGGYNTLTDIMLEPPEKFCHIRNFGRKSEKELFALRKFVISSDRETILGYCENKGKMDMPKPKRSSDDLLVTDLSVLEVAFNKMLESPEVVFINSDGDYCSDISINENTFSVRTKNVLISNGLDSLLKVSKFRYQELLKLKGMGQKGLNELMKVLKEKVIINESDENVGNSEINDTVKEIESFFDGLIDSSVLVKKEKELAAAVVCVCGKDADISSLNEASLIDIAKKSPINHQLRHLILSAVSEKIYYGIDKNTFVSIVSNHESKFYPILNAVIDEMIDDKQIRLVSGKLYRHKVFLNEWINTLEGSYKIALECRCNGMTLEEIGRKLDITRERARQLVAKSIRHRPNLYEDDYAEFVERYYFNNEEFSALFNLTVKQINYLLFSYKRGNGDVQDFLDDSSVPVCFKERVPETFKGKVLVLDGECIPLKRDVLLQKLLKIFCSDKDRNIEEFAEFYMCFLRENNIADYENLLFPNRRALEARVSDCPCVIAKTGHKIRYYDTAIVDINVLLEALDIGRYMDTEISTLKLIRDWPEVMEQYDIRDEYELHNLIRKKINEIENYSISVTRMPLITIGNGDRIKQVEDLLLKMAPVTNIGLAAEYERQYGVRAETVLTNFFKCIDVFYHDGIFDLEQRDLTADEYAALHSELTEEIYLWDTIGKIYHSISLDPKPDAINAMTLKKLGFRVYSQYVVSAKYPSADAFFTSLLLKNESLDLSELPHVIRTIQAYYSALTVLRDSLELIEVGKDLFYRYDYFAETYSIESKEELINLGAEVLSRLDDTEYFSIEAITLGDAIYDLPDITRNQYILNSILRVQPGTKTSRIANTYIGAKKENNLSQLGIINYLVKKEGGMSISNLILILRNRFCMNLERSRILYVIDGSESVVYDEIFDYVCLRTEWSGYDGPVYISETRFADDIEKNRENIENSDVLIAKIYYKDKYTEFVDYCGMNNCFKMKDILKLDFRKLYENASRLNISRGAVSDLANIFIEWANNLSVSERIEQEPESIMNLFFLSGR